MFLRLLFFLSLSAPLLSPVHLATTRLMSHLPFNFATLDFELACSPAFRTSPKLLSSSLTFEQSSEQSTACRAGPAPLALAAILLIEARKVCEAVGWRRSASASRRHGRSVSASGVINTIIDSLTSSRSPSCLIPVRLLFER